MTSSFHQALLQRITADMGSLRTGNVDLLRFPTEAKLISRAKRAAAEFVDTSLSRLGLLRCNAFQRAGILQRMSLMRPHLEDLAWLHDRLADDISRNTLVEVIAFRILGHRHTRLSVNNIGYSRALHVLQHETMKRAHAGRTNLLDGWMDDYEVRAGSDVVRMRAHKLNILNTFLLEQYRFASPNGDCVEVLPGDVVVDGGGCWGDTTLYFASRAGAGGQVHVFEFSDENLGTLHDNLATNPELKARITVHQEALWDVSGERLSFDEQGPATRLGEISRAVSARHAMTRSIDDWADVSGIGRVDFIKLDVEGAEARCLEGARRTIQTSRPRLAVALYHSIEDFALLPRLIDQIQPGYRLHLGHFTIHEEETILFATAQP